MFVKKEERIEASKKYTQGWKNSDPLRKKCFELNKIAATLYDA